VPTITTDNAPGRHAFRCGETMLLLEGEIGPEHQGRCAEQAEALLHDGPCDRERRKGSEDCAADEARTPADALHQQRRRHGGEREAEDQQRQRQRREHRRRRESAAEDPAQQRHRHHSRGRQSLRRGQHQHLAHRLRPAGTRRRRRAARSRDN
jgi:hypothetical protein